MIIVSSFPRDNDTRPFISGKIRSLRQNAGSRIRWLPSPKTGLMNFSQFYTTEKKFVTIDDIGISIPLIRKMHRDL